MGLNNCSWEVWGYRGLREGWWSGVGFLPSSSGSQLEVQSGQSRTQRSSLEIMGIWLAFKTTGLDEIIKAEGVG